MVSVQRNPTLSYVVLPEGTRRGAVFTVHETGAPGPPKPRLLAHFGHREHADRSMVNAQIGAS
jgi:hypothetical protein